MSKSSSDDDNDDDSRQESRSTTSQTQSGLEWSLGQLGQNGTNFLARLENAHPIPTSLSESLGATLNSLNALATLVHSEPYSAIVLRDNVLYSTE
jgi:hypothetical protein